MYINSLKHVDLDIQTAILDPDQIKSTYLQSSSSLPYLTTVTNALTSSASKKDYEVEDPVIPYKLFGHVSRKVKQIGKLVCGGKNVNDELQDICLIYNYNLNQWKTLTHNNITLHLNEMRHFACIKLVDKKVIISGGRKMRGNPYPKCLQSMDVLDLGNMSLGWQLEFPLSVPLNCSHFLCL